MKKYIVFFVIVGASASLYAAENSIEEMKESEEAATILREEIESLVEKLTEDLQNDQEEIEFDALENNNVKRAQFIKKRQGVQREELLKVAQDLRNERAIIKEEITQRENHYEQKENLQEIVERLTYRIHRIEAYAKGELGQEQLQEIIKKCNIKITRANASDAVAALLIQALDLIALANATINPILKMLPAEATERRTSGQTILKYVLAGGVVLYCVAEIGNFFQVWRVPTPFGLRELVLTGVNAFI